MSDDAIELAAGVATTHTTGRLRGRIEFVELISSWRRCAVKQKLATLSDALGPDGSDGKTGCSPV